MGIHYYYEVPAKLLQDVCGWGPQLLQINDPVLQHVVTAYGKDPNANEFLVMDPVKPLGQNFTTTANYTAPWGFQLRYRGPKGTFFDPQTGTYIEFYSPVDAFVTDPQGRRVGVDPRIGATFNEIPGSTYTEGVLMGPVDYSSDPPKNLDLHNVPDGEYQLSVVGTAAGTYTAELHNWDLNRNSSRAVLADIPTDLGVEHRYVLQISRTSASSSALVGAFDGGGQRPRDVNRFLSYGNPTDSPATTAPGANSFPLVIFYGATTIPATFSATLNGADITGSFHPAAGTNEMVLLGGLQPGSNILKVSIDGNLANRVATDSDRLVVRVP